MVTHPSTFYLLRVINTHSSFIRGADALFTFECGVLFIRRAIRMSQEAKVCHAAACNIYLTKKSYVD